jgi:hypothetical protein
MSKWRLFTAHPWARRPCRRNGAAIRTCSPASPASRNRPSWRSAARHRGRAEGRAVDRREDEGCCRRSPRRGRVAGDLGEFRRRVSHSLRARPRGMRTRSPLTSAPASRQRSSAAGFSTNPTPISSSTVSAFSSMIWSASSFRISRFGMLRSMNFAVSKRTAERSARRAAPPPPRPRRPTRSASAMTPPDPSAVLCRDVACAGAEPRVGFRRLRGESDTCGPCCARGSRLHLARTQTYGYGA